MNSPGKFNCWERTLSPASPISRPGKAGCAALFDDMAQPVHKGIPVRIVIEDPAAADASGDDVMQRPGRIYPG